jgi:hypothetical protein
LAFVIGALLVVASIAVAVGVLQSDRPGARAARRERVDATPAFSEAA